MKEADLSVIESRLEVKLPKEVRRLLILHGGDLAGAAKIRQTDVAWETKSARIVNLNRMLRKYGIEGELNTKPAPWPPEYLAMSDNGGGDHECIKLDTAAGSVWEFNGEEGIFHKKFPSLKAYLEDLDKQIKAYQAGPKGQSDPKMLKAMVLTDGFGSSLVLGVGGIQRADGSGEQTEAQVDRARAVKAVAALLEAVTRIPADQWKLSAKIGERGLEIRYSTKAKPVGTVTWLRTQMIWGDLSVGVHAEKPEVAAKAWHPDWKAFEAALATLQEVALGRPVAFKLGSRTGREFDKYGYKRFTWQYGVKRV